METQEAGKKRTKGATDQPVGEYWYNPKTKEEGPRASPKTEPSSKRSKSSGQMDSSTEEVSFQDKIMDSLEAANLGSCMGPMEVDSKKDPNHVHKILCPDLETLILEVTEVPLKTQFDMQHMFSL